MSTSISKLNHWKLLIIKWQCSKCGLSESITYSNCIEEYTNWFKKILIKLTYPLAWNVAVVFTSHEFHKSPESRSILPSVERVLIAAIFINRPHQIFLRTIHTCYWRKSINYIISVIYECAHEKRVLWHFFRKQRNNVTKMWHTVFAEWRCVTSAHFFYNVLFHDKFSLFWCF